jgi:hypothetical protein
MRTQGGKLGEERDGPVKRYVGIVSVYIKHISRDREHGRELIDLFKKDSLDVAGYSTGAAGEPLVRSCEGIDPTAPGCWELVRVMMMVCSVP